MRLLISEIPDGADLPYITDSIKRIVSDEAVIVQVLE